MNIFMRTGIDKQGKAFYEPPLAKKGDFIDFLAEMDCLVAISACPGKSSGPEPDRLGVEIFDVVKPRGVKQKDLWAHIKKVTPRFERHVNY